MRNKETPKEGGNSPVSDLTDDRHYHGKVIYPNTPVFGTECYEELEGKNKYFYPCFKGKIIRIHSRTMNKVYGVTSKEKGPPYFSALFNKRMRGNYRILTETLKRGEKRGPTERINVMAADRPRRKSRKTVQLPYVRIEKYPEAIELEKNKEKEAEPEGEADLTEPEETEDEAEPEEEANLTEPEEIEDLEVVENALTAAEPMEMESSQAEPPSQECEEMIATNNEGEALTSENPESNNVEKENELEEAIRRHNGRIEDLDEKIKEMDETIEDLWKEHEKSMMKIELVRELTESTRLEGRSYREFQEEIRLDYLRKHPHVPTKEEKEAEEYWSIYTPKSPPHSKSPVRYDALTSYRQWYSTPRQERKSRNEERRTPRSNERRRSRSSERRRSRSNEQRRSRSSERRRSRSNEQRRKVPDGTELWNPNASKEEQLQKYSDYLWSRIDKENEVLESVLIVQASVPAEKEPLKMAEFDNKFAKNAKLSLSLPDPIEFRMKTFKVPVKTVPFWPPRVLCTYNLDFRPAILFAHSNQNDLIDEALKAKLMGAENEDRTPIGLAYWTYVGRKKLAGRWVTNERDNRIYMLAVAHVAFIGVYYFRHDLKSGGCECPPYLKRILESERFLKISHNVIELMYALENTWPDLKLHFPRDFRESARNNLELADGVYDYQLKQAGFFAWRVRFAGVLKIDLVKETDMPVQVIEQISLSAWNDFQYYVQGHYKYEKYHQEPLEWNDKQKARRNLEMKLLEKKLSSMDPGSIRAGYEQRIEATKTRRALNRKGREITSPRNANRLAGMIG